MKTLLTTIGLFFIISSLGAQASFDWGLSATPNFSHRRLIAQDVINRAEVDSLEELEIAKISYSAGALVRWRSEKIGFQTGINYMNSGHRTRRVPVEPVDPAPSLGATEKRTVFRNIFIEVPAELQFFQELNDNNDFLFMMGITLSYNINNTTDLVFYNGESQEVVEQPTDNDQFSRVNYSFIAGMGWEHQFGENFIMSLQPTFQFWLRPLLNDINLPLNRNLYAVGLRASAYFRVY
jgi:outer membrane translocation and assembly module TamA